MSGAANLTPVVDTRSAYTAHLDELARSLAGIRGAVLSSVDGFSLAHSSVTASSEEKLAAMTSSMLGLATAVGRELTMGDLNMLMLEADKGKVLMIRVEGGPEPMLLMVACSDRSVMGEVLWLARKCAGAIASTAIAT